LLALPAARAADDPFPRVADAYSVSVDGRVLWAKQADKHLPQASLTKLMTVLLALESLDGNEIVTVGADAAEETGTRLGIRSGERYLARDLLAATLIQSANDACHALMDTIAGSERAFVALMNRRAAEWGLSGTHFSNGCGHDEANHYSTVNDLARLARYALQNRVLLGMASIDAVPIDEVDGKRHFEIANSNVLIGRYPGALGLKTGFTPGAGKCLIAYAERNGKKVLLVMLNAPNRWWDAAQILDIAFAYDP